MSGKRLGARNGIAVPGSPRTRAGSGRRELRQLSSRADACGSRTTPPRHRRHRAGQTPPLAASSPVQCRRALEGPGREMGRGAARPGHPERAEAADADGGPVGPERPGRETRPQTRTQAPTPGRDDGRRYGCAATAEYSGRRAASGLRGLMTRTPPESAASGRKQPPRGPGSHTPSGSRVGNAAGPVGRPPGRGPGTGTGSPTAARGRRRGGRSARDGPSSGRAVSRRETPD